MITQTQRAEQHIVLHHISWDGYESMLSAVGENRVRLTYDDGDLEIMTLSFGHENAGEWIGRLVFFLALELKLKLCSGGATTLKKALRKKGLEPDKCFWIKHEKLMRGKTDWDADGDPPPDLVVEVDVTHSSLNRLDIYATLKVPEIWHFDGETFKVLTLRASGKYKQSKTSAAFPQLPLKGFAEFVMQLGTDDEVALIQLFSEWIRTVVMSRESKDNGRRKRKNASS